MSSERVAIDTNILLYILGGDKTANELLKGHDVVASTMVRMEALVYHGDDAGPCNKYTASWSAASWKRSIAPSRTWLSICAYVTA